jgi:hypothetical protein
MRHYDCTGFASLDGVAVLRLSAAVGHCKATKPKFFSYDSESAVEVAHALDKDRLRLFGFMFEAAPETHNYPGKGNGM